MSLAIFNERSKKTKMQIAQVGNGDLSLQIFSNSLQLQEIPLDTVQNCSITIHLNSVPHVPVFVPPGADNLTPLLYMALYELGAAISPQLNAKAFSLLSEENNLLRRHRIQDGVFVVPVLPDPRQHQIVLCVNGKDAFLRSEYIEGYPPRDGNPGQWAVWQSPDFQFSLGRNALSTQWRRIAKAIQIHATLGRQPFGDMVRETPYMDLIV